MNVTHKLSGHTGEIQDTVTDNQGQVFHYFEDHARPSVAGWYAQHNLTIPGVNA